MIVSTMTKSAIAFTIGSSCAGPKFVKIQIGNVCLRAGGEVRYDDLVERERECQQPAGEKAVRATGTITCRNVVPAVRAEIGRRLLEGPRRPPQSRDHVVVDDDDAERRVPDDDRRQTRS